MASSWNPLKCSGTPLPPNLLIIAKTIAMVTLLKGNGRLDVGPVFLPFFPIFDKIFNPGLFQWCVECVIVLAALGIMTNRYVRTCCFIFACALLAATLGNRIGFSTATVFTAAVLIVLSLHESGHRQALMNYQLGILYFGAALDKLLQPGWRSGLFMQDWSSKLPDSLLHKFVSLFPPMTVVVVLCYATIFAESLLSILTCFRLLLPFTIWFGVMMHIVFSLMTGVTLGYFLFAVPISYLGLITVPIAPIKVVLDKDSRFCRWACRLVQYLDFDDAFTWEEFRTAAPRDHFVQVTDGGKIYSDFSGLRQMVLRCSSSYLLFVLMVSLITPERTVSPLAGLAMALPIFLFCPLFAAPGRPRER